MEEMDKANRVGLLGSLFFILLKDICYWHFWSHCANRNYQRNFMTSQWKRRLDTSDISAFMKYISVVLKWWKCQNIFLAYRSYMYQTIDRNRVNIYVIMVYYKFLYTDCSIFMDIYMYNIHAKMITYLIIYRISHGLNWFFIQLVVCFLSPRHELDKNIKSQTMGDSFYHIPIILWTV
jgi:hypothetical protein